MFKIVVFASNEIDFLIRKNEILNLSFNDLDIIWCNSSIKTRTSVINENKGVWLLFIDHDCVVNQHLLSIVADLVIKLPKKENIVFTGRYINTAECNYLQKAHNFIANTWYEQSYAVWKQPHLLLGGIFLINSSKNLSAFKEVKFWGAEDKALSYELNDQNFKFCKIDEFNIEHFTSRDILHFLKRAYLHGKNDILYIKNNRNSINYFFWIRKIGFANVNLLPLILLHFCIQRVARLIQTILQLNKQ